MNGEKLQRCALRPLHHRNPVTLWKSITNRSMAAGMNSGSSIHTESSFICLQPYQQLFFLQAL